MVDRQRAALGDRLTRHANGRLGSLLVRIDVLAIERNPVALGVGAIHRPEMVVVGTILGELGTILAAGGINDRADVTVRASLGGAAGFAVLVASRRHIAGNVGSALSVFHRCRE